MSRQARDLGDHGPYDSSEQPRYDCETCLDSGVVRPWEPGPKCPDCDGVPSLAGEKAPELAAPEKPEHVEHRWKCPLCGRQYHCAGGAIVCHKVYRPCGNCEND